MMQDKGSFFVFEGSSLGWSTCAQRSAMFSAGDAMLPGRPGPVSSRYSVLYPSSPRTPRARASYVIPFFCTVVLLLVALLFPHVVQQLHCIMGLKLECSSAVGVSQAVMYNRYAIQRSCTPTKEGGKVVVVTGSAGFIGFSAALALKSRGDGVVGIDNFNDYYPVSLKHARAAELATAGVHTVHADINNINVLQQTFEVRLYSVRSEFLSLLHLSVPILLSLIHI